MLVVEENGVISQKEVDVELLVPGDKVSGKTRESTHLCMHAK